MGTAPIVLNALAILAAALGIAGLAAFVRGAFGRRVGRHPACRRCNYDLSGQTDASSSPAPSTCSECGADLGRRRAVARGIRVRSARLAMLGLLLLLVGVGTIGVTVGPRLAGTDWLTKMPTVILLWGETVGTDRWRFEIADRIERGEIDAAATQRLVDRMIGRLEALHEIDRLDGSTEGATLRAGGVALGELRILEGAFLIDAMSDAQLGRWIEALLPGLLSVSFVEERSRAVGGGVLPAPQDAHMTTIARGSTPIFRIAKSMVPTSGAVTGSRYPPIQLIVHIDELRGASLDGPIPIDWGMTTQVFGSSRSGRSWHRDLPLGHHELEATGSVTVHRLSATPTGRLRRHELAIADPVEPNEPLHRWTIRLPLSIEVVEAPPPVVVTPVIDPALRDAVRAAIRIERGAEAVARHFGGGGMRGVDDAIVISVDPSTPVPVCMLISVLSGSRETMLGLLCPGATRPMPLLVQPVTLRMSVAAGAETVDIILRPAAESFGQGIFDRLGADSYWNEEIVIEGVPIDAPVDEVE